MYKIWDTYGNKARAEAVLGTLYEAGYEAYIEIVGPSFILMYSTK